MSSFLPIYLDSDNEFCQALPGDFVDIPQGGTGATTVTGAVSNLGLTIGVGTQAWSPKLDSISALNGTGFLVQTGASTYSEVSLSVVSTGRLTIVNGNGSSGGPTFDLSTVANSGLGSFQKFVSDGYGRVTGTTAVTASDIGALVDSRYIQTSGAVLTGPLVLAADPVTALGAATKQYVDNSIQGLNQKPTAWVATTAPLPTNTYNNGTLGVGATLTASSTGVLNVDGVNVTQNMLVFVKNEVAGANNGLYVCTTAGATGVPYVLTRSPSMDQEPEFNGALIVVESGSGTGLTNAGSLWISGTSGTVLVGTTLITFTELNKGTDLSPGNGIQISGNAVSVLPVNTGRLVASGSGLDLASGVVAPGTYNQVTVDTYGRVVAGSSTSANSSTTSQQLTNSQGSAVVIGQAVYTNSSGTFQLAQASSLGTRLVTGLVQDTAIASSAVGNVAIGGVLTATLAQWNAVTLGSGGLVPGSKYWLSNTTAGGLTSVAPTTGWLVLVGKAISTTQMEIVTSSQPIRLS